MNKLVFKKLFIFDYHNKLAKVMEFDKGINVITSKMLQGNDVGKSVMMKSLYHTLGADTYFDDLWEEHEKIYYLEITVNEETYSVYRNGNLFKIFDVNLNKIFFTNKRSELSNFLTSLYEFEVLLPNRQNNELETCPPSFQYILNFIDQDHLEGTNFNSFKSLGQYKNYKEHVIYNHFGIYNKTYFNLIRDLEGISLIESQLIKEKNLVSGMILKIETYLDSTYVPTNTDALEIELDKLKSEYTVIVNKLNSVKRNIVGLKNQKYDLEISVKELSELENKNIKIFKSVVTDKCPVCNRETDLLNYKIDKSNEIEDFIFLKDEMDCMLLSINEQLSKCEHEYKTVLDRYKYYENKISIVNTNVSNVLSYMGYIESINNLTSELGNLELRIQSILKDKKEVEKSIKKYNELKRNANQMYQNNMIKAKDEFDIEEIKPEQLKSIKNTFLARGSNRPVSTIIWYLNLLSVKNKLNPNSIKFPLVLDSPNNGELDDEKRVKLINYIFMNHEENTQLVISTLGFKQDDYPNFKVNKIIELTNDKYHLLNTSDYDLIKDLVLELSRK